jgi:hypothetical protein
VKPSHRRTRRPRSCRNCAIAAGRQLIVSICAAVPRLAQPTNNLVATRRRAKATFRLRDLGALRQLVVDGQLLLSSPGRLTVQAIAPCARPDFAPLDISILVEGCIHRRGATTARLTPRERDIVESRWPARVCPLSPSWPAR